MIFLEVFECDHFREVEDNILKDPLVVKHLYKQPIKLEGGKSKEVVKLSDKFNYKQLLALVKKHVKETNFFTPSQLLEKQKLNNEILLAIINSPTYSNDVSQIIKELLPNILQDTLSNISQNINTEKITPKNEETEIIKPNYNKNYSTQLRRHKPMGNKIQKIDPNNLKNIVNVYDSMIYLLRAPENSECSSNGIRKAIKKNTIYKEFRWNILKEGEDENVSNVSDTVITNVRPNVSSVIQLNDTKTKIINSFSTKVSLANHLGMGTAALRRIIRNCTKVDSSYYVEFQNCPKELLENYDGTIKKCYHIIQNKLNKLIQLQINL